MTADHHDRELRTVITLIPTVDLKSQSSLSFAVSARSSVNVNLKVGDPLIIIYETNLNQKANPKSNTYH